MRKLTLILLVLKLLCLGTLSAQSISSKQIIKTKPYTPLLNNLSFGYEKSITDTRSIEFSVGLIGAGFNENDYFDAKGLFVTAGPRFYMRKKQKEGGLEKAALTGLFFKPELIISSYKGTNSFQDWITTDIIEEEFNATAFAGIFNLGYQFIFADIISLDISGGLGYGYSKFKEEKREDALLEHQRSGGRFYSHIQGHNKLPWAAKGEVTIGYVFKQ